MEADSSYYWVVSEIETHPSQPQRYLSESRQIKTAVSARDWRDFVESQYRKKGDDRDVLLVKVLTPKDVETDIAIEVARNREEYLKQKEIELLESIPQWGTVPFCPEKEHKWHDTPPYGRVCVKCGETDTD